MNKLLIHEVHKKSQCENITVALTSLVLTLCCMALSCSQEIIKLKK